MAGKIVKFDTDARNAMLKGVDILANAVKVTFTALASTSTPLSIEFLASVSNLTIFPAILISS